MHISNCHDEVNAQDKDKENDRYGYQLKQHTLPLKPKEPMGKQLNYTIEVYAVERQRQWGRFKRATHLVQATFKAWALRTSKCILCQRMLMLTSVSVCV